MVEVTEHVIKAWYDRSSGLHIELYYKFLNTIKPSDIVAGQLLLVGGKTYPIIDWDLSKESGNPVFRVKGFEPAVKLINNLNK